MKTVIKPQTKRSIADDLSLIWSYRELVTTLSLRELSVRYKQAVIGVLWVVLQPLITTAIYTIVFGRIAKVPSEGAPYPVFVFSGQLLWQYFSRCVTEGSNSLVTNKDMITKVYFPRQILPLSISLSAMVDTAIAFIILVLLCLIYGIVPGPAVLATPVIMLFTGLFAYGITLWTSPTNAIYRDVGIALPFVVNIAMFLTPVIYPVSFVPEKFQWVFYLNPMATLIELNRWAFIGTEPPGTIAITCAGVMIIALVWSGFHVFRRLETMMIDRI
jgi:lipopolysaccharide transport system permease protein